MALAAQEEATVNPHPTGADGDHRGREGGVARGHELVVQGIAVEALHPEHEEPAPLRGFRCLVPAGGLLGDRGAGSPEPREGGEEECQGADGTRWGAKHGFSVQGAGRV